MKRKMLILLAILAIICAACSQRTLKTVKVSTESEERESQSEASSQSAPQESESEKPSAAQKLSQQYAKMLLEKKYYIDCTAVINMEGMTLENSMLIAVEGENSSISVSSDLSGTMKTMRTLTFEGNIYMVNDAQRTYMQIEASQSANSFNTDFSELQYEQNETADFCGEEKPCESYSCGEDTVRFFFENNALIGITRSIKDEQLNEMTLKVNGVSQNIPDRLVAMPLGYTKQ